MRAIDEARERQITATQTQADGKIDVKTVSDAQRDLAMQRFRLTVFDTAALTRKARELGVEIPRNNTWWYNDNDDGSLPPEDVSYYLINLGKTAVKKLIREERRKNIEWWVKILTPVLGALISLLGLIIALITVLRNSPPPR